MTPTVLNLAFFTSLHAVSWAFTRSVAVVLQHEVSPFYAVFAYMGSNVDSCMSAGEKATQVEIPESDLEITTTRSQGAGEQPIHLLVPCPGFGASTFPAAKVLNFHRLGQRRLFKAACMPQLSEFLM